MPWRSQNDPTKWETICGSLSYVTCGLTGLLYILLAKNGSPSNWFRFNMYQAVFLSLLGMVIGWATDALLGIIFGVTGAVMPGITGGARGLAGLIVAGVSSIFGILLIVGAVMAFFRKSPEVPYISPMIRTKLR